MFVSPKTIEKIKQFCAYQERSQKQVLNKLQEFSVEDCEKNYIISLLIEENFINEKRFALAYARGKFNLKHWGKRKIDHGLKSHDIHSALRKKALDEISPQEYFSIIQLLVKKKIKLLSSENNKFILKNKVFRYLYTKGFESNLIEEVLQNECL